MTKSVVTLNPSSDLTASFGKKFTEHILVADFDGKWGEPEICLHSDPMLPPAPHVAHYGQSLFEGLKARRTAAGSTAIFRPRKNFERLNRTAKRLAMPVVPENIFLDGMKALLRVDEKQMPIEEDGALYIRPVYFSTDAAIGVKPSKRYRFVIMLAPVGDYFSKPVSLLAETTYARAFPGGTGDVKAAANYAMSLFPTQQAQEQGFDHVLWLDAVEHKFVEECGVMNVVFVVDGTLVTPALTGTILPGITRDSILALARKRGISTDERLIAIEELFDLHAQGRLTEAGGVGTAATITPIDRIEFRGKSIHFAAASSNSVLQLLKRDYLDVVTGSTKSEWLTYL